MADDGPCLEVPLILPPDSRSWFEYTFKTIFCKSCCQNTTETGVDILDTLPPPAYLHDEHFVASCLTTSKHNEESYSPTLSPPVHMQDDCEMKEYPEVEIETGARYRGQWKGPHCHGRGCLRRNDGSCYDGEFVEGQAHGYGKFVGSNGNIYEGCWDMDRAHGRGKYSFNDGSTYDGEWCEDEKSGHGLERWAEGSYYEGQFLSGGKHGFGSYMTSTGAVVFSGQFQSDMMHGEGYYNFTNGRTYSGQWHGGHIHGEGTMGWPDGSQYTGTFRRDLRHGVGTIIWQDGKSYKGQWIDGSQDGHGVIKDVDGTEMPGVWKLGQLVEDEVPASSPAEYPEERSDSHPAALERDVIADVQTGSSVACEVSTETDTSTPYSDGGVIAEDRPGASDVIGKLTTQHVGNCARSLPPVSVVNGASVEAERVEAFSSADAGGVAEEGLPGATSNDGIVHEIPL